jgi:tetratricopeptide (TPR) repeat protein
LNLGIAFREFGEFHKAIAYYQKSLPLVKARQDKTMEAACYTNLGIAYRGLAEFRKAIEYHYKALEIKQTVADKAGEARCYSNIGNVHDILGDFEKALFCHAKSLTIFQAIGNKSGELLCYTNIGNVYDSLEQTHQAVEAHHKALAIAQQIKDKRGEAICLTNLGNAYHHARNVKTAIKYHKQALDRHKELQNRDGEWRCYVNLSRAYLHLDDVTTAIEYQERLLNGIQEEDEIDRDLERIIMQNLGILYYAYDSWESAHTCFRRAIELIEDTGQNLLEERHKMGFYGQRSDVFQYMIHLCHHLNHTQEMFIYTEQSKSKAFLEMLAFTEIRPSPPLLQHTTLLEDEHGCLAKLHAIRMLREQNNFRSIEFTEVDRMLARLEHIYNEMELIDSEYVFMRRGRPLSCRQIQETLSG